VPYATAHNGGRAQTQTYFPQYGNDYAPINLMKYANPWVGQTSQEHLTPTQVDANGWPTDWSDGAPYTGFFAPGPDTGLSNSWWVLAQGEGSIVVGAATVLEGSLTASGGTLAARISLNSVVTDPTQSPYRQHSITLTVATRGAGSYLTNIAFVHADQLTRYQAGEKWNSVFVDRLIEGGVGLLRTLDWSPANLPCVALWEHNKSINNFSWSAGEMRADHWGGDTTNSSQDFTCSVPSGGFSYTHGEIVLCRFNTAANSSGSRLRVGAGAYKPIRLGNVTALSGGATVPAGRVSALMYHQTLDCFLFWGDGLGSRCLPTEAILDLCATVGCHAWVHAPVTALEPLTDYAAGLATFCKTFAETHAPWMKFFGEPGNEIWNKTYGFDATYVAEAIGNALWGLTENHDQAYGMFASRLGAAWKTVFSNDTSKFAVMCSTQTLFGGPKLDERLNAAEYVADGGTSARSNVQAVAGASYWNAAAQWDNTAASAYAADYAAATGNAAAQQAIIEEFVETGWDWVENELREKVEEIGLIATTGGFLFVVYEGSYSPDDCPSYLPNYAARTVLTRASKNARAIEPITQYVCRLFRDNGATFLSWYTITGYSAWGCCYPTIYDADTPSFRALTREGKGRALLRFVAA
jgi:hypothetical protein